MAIEQFSRAESASDFGRLNNLNLLDLSDSNEAPKRPVDVVSNSPAKAEAHALDFSVPVFPGEGRPVTEPAEVERKLPNKYEKTVAGQLEEMNDEAKFTVHTRDAFLRDADRFPPVRDDNEGRTTYTMELIGFSDREIPDGEAIAEPYKRLVNITVPDTAASLKDCKFEFQDREKISQRELSDLVARAQKRQAQLSESADDTHKLSNPSNISFFTHGIRTAAASSDLYALSLQLTNGHSVVNVDWKSVPPSEEKGFNLVQAYRDERSRAAESYPRFEKLIDDTIRAVGAERTDMIAFSHGAMFDTRYLQHRKDSGAALLNHVIFSHPDVPNRIMPQPGQDGAIVPESRLYSSVSNRTHVIGSTADMAMAGAAQNDAEADGLPRWKAMLQPNEAYWRIGNGAQISRNLVEGCGGTYVVETQKGEKKDAMCHFINMAGIAELMNTPQVLRISQKR